MNQLIILFAGIVLYTNISFAKTVCKTDRIEAEVTEYSVYVISSTIPELDRALKYLGLSYPLELSRIDTWCHFQDGSDPKPIGYCETALFDSRRLFLELKEIKLNSFPILYSKVFKCE